MTRTELKEMGLLDFFLRLCEQEHVLLEGLLGPKRTARLNAARVVAYVYLRSLGMSYPEVAAIFDRDHTSVMVAVRGHGPKLAKVVPIGAGK
jgi:chromosomal replication initiation ATPase DnaA